MVADSGQRETDEVAVGPGRAPVGEAGAGWEGGGEEGAEVGWEGEVEVGFDAAEDRVREAREEGDGGGAEVGEESVSGKWETRGGAGGSGRNGGGGAKIEAAEGGEVGWG